MIFQVLRTPFACLKLHKMMVKATMFLTCIVCSCVHNSGAGGWKWSTYRRLKYDEKFEITLDGKLEQMKLSGTDAITVQGFKHLTVKSMVIQRRNQFIKELFFKCNDKFIFRCHRSANGAKEFAPGSKILTFPWAIRSPSKCSGNDDSDYCIKDGDCTAACCTGKVVGDQSECPRYNETMDCRRQENREKCGVTNEAGDSTKYKCKSMPGLLNPGCISEGCVGLNWKRSNIQIQDCKMRNANFRIQMKLWKQASTRGNLPTSHHNHAQTIIFRVDGDDAEEKLGPHALKHDDEA